VGEFFNHYLKNYLFVILMFFPGTFKIFSCLRLNFYVFFILQLIVTPLLQFYLVSVTLTGGISNLRQLRACEKIKSVARTSQNVSHCVVK
jgi:hypothetical protein